MRNSILILLALLIFAPGTAWAEKEQAATTLEGRVQPAGPSIYMEGSHELVDANGKQIARLSGSCEEVDLASVEGRWVRVTGAWQPTIEAGGRIFVVSGIAELAKNP